MYWILKLIIRLVCLRNGQHMGHAQVDASYGEGTSTTAGGRGIGVVEEKSPCIKATAPINFHTVQIDGLGWVDDARNALDLHQLILRHFFLKGKNITQAGATAALHPYPQKLIAVKTAFIHQPMQFGDGRRRELHHCCCIIRSMLRHHSKLLTKTEC